ncbi:MAG: anti-sigma factor family protein [Candidatus Zhuqueibacterota bacterium]
MSLKHLTDRQIQRYLDRANAEDNAEIMAHVAQCAECQRSIQAYRAVYQELQSEPKASFSPAFEDAILARLSPQPDRKFQFWKYLLMAASIILGVVLPIGYFLKLHVPASSFQFLNQLWLNFSDSYFFGLEILERLHITIEYLIPAGSILLFFSLFEKAMAFSKRRKTFITHCL